MSLSPQPSSPPGPQTHFVDRLLTRIATTGGPVCVGIDPIFGLLPESLRARGDTPTHQLDAIVDFSLAVLKHAANHAACVKFQSAYFERYRAPGVDAYFSLVTEAKSLGLEVIGDVKRGDIGSTSQAYAEAHLAEPDGVTHDDMEDEVYVTPDAITVIPMLGLDGVEPFITLARGLGKGVFLLVRTSNPGSAALQDVKLADGRTWSEALADLVAPLADLPGMAGVSGWSNLGAVVGATQTHTMLSLRKRLPRCIFLLPGYGTQGATAEMTRAAFIQGRGAIVSASRSILYAYREEKYRPLADRSWELAVEAAMLDMKRDLTTILAS